MFATILGRRMGVYGAFCVAFSNIDVQLDWSMGVYRLLTAPPNPMDENIRSAVHTKVRSRS